MDCIVTCLEDSLRRGGDMHVRKGPDSVEDEESRETEPFLPSWGRYRVALMLSH
ncbi:hypothetical protein GHT09_019577 [Marmota monax]|uniref:Uncharacterized protein n=1 Tax=Marmota monax TaxID=9995 RepID=A0A834UIR0_MARMO|nr:hypothetical protein GHT09_019577 [Marmota monax]